MPFHVVLQSSGIILKAYIHKFKRICIEFQANVLKHIQHLVYPPTLIILVQKEDEKFTISQGK